MANPVRIGQDAALRPADYAQPSIQTNFSQVERAASTVFKTEKEQLSEVRWNRAFAITKAIGYSIAFAVFVTFAVASALLIVPGITAPAAIPLAIGSGLLALASLALAISAITDAVAAKGQIQQMRKALEAEQTKKAPLIA